MSACPPETAGRLVAIHFLSSAGEWMAIILLQILLFRATGSPGSILLLGLCEMVPAIFVGPWAGRIVDRVNLRRALMVAGGVRLGFTALLAVPLLWAHPAALLTIAVLLAVASRFFGPAASALVPQMAGTKGLAALSASALAARTAGMAAGGALTGLIVDGGWPLVLCGLLTPLTATLWLSRSLPRGRFGFRNKARETPPASIAGTISANRLAGPIGASMLVSLMLGLFELLAIPYGTRVLGQPASVAAFLFTTYGAGLLGGLMLAARPDRLPPWRLSVAGSVGCMIAASWFLGSVDQLMLALPAVFGAGFAEGLILSLSLLRIYEATRTGQVAASVALFDAATATAFMAGYVLAGGLVTILPVAETMRVSAVVAVVLFAAGVFAVRWLDGRGASGLPAQEADTG